MLKRHGCSEETWMLGLQLYKIETASDLVLKSKFYHTLSTGNTS